MNDSQKEALTKAEQLLGEHFDAYTVIVELESDNGRADETFVSYEGGISRHRGMIEFCRDTMIAKRSSEMIQQLEDDEQG